MKYVIYQWFKKGFAALVAAIMAFTGSGNTTPPEKDRPDANTVTAYSTGDSDYTLNIDAGDEIHDISDLLFGIFFEDINFAADGGLYAEMVANRSFEYTELAVNDSLYAWNSVGVKTLASPSHLPYQLTIPLSKPTHNPPSRPFLN